MKSMYLARVWIVEVPGKKKSEKASRIVPMPSSSRVSVSRQLASSSSMRRCCSTDESTHVSVAGMAGSSCGDNCAILHRVTSVGNVLRCRQICNLPSRRTEVSA